MAKAGMYSLFATNSDMETNGIYIDYDSFRVKIARAGGDNKQYARVLERRARPYRRGVETGVIGIELERSVMREVYAETIILDWEIKQIEEKENSLWLQGIESPDGETLPFNVENVIMTLKNLPDLFIDLVQQANRIALFREEALDIESGN